MKMKKPITRKAGSPRSRSGAVVHNPTRREGGQPGNRNGQKGMTIPDLKLENSDEILRFMREVLIPSTLSGQIGTRQSSAITTACKLLLDYESLEKLEARLSRLEMDKVKAN